MPVINPTDRPGAMVADTLTVPGPQAEDAG